MNTNEQIRLLQMRLNDMDKQLRALQRLEVSGLTLTYSGTPSASSVAYWTGAGTIAGTATFVYDQANARLGLGTATPVTLAHFADATLARITIEQLSANATAPGFNYKKARGAGVTVNDADFLGLFSYQPHDGTDYIRTAHIAAKVNGTVGTGSVPTDILISTGAADDPSLNNQRLVVRSSDAVEILQPTLGNAVLQLSSTATNDDPSEIVYHNRVATTDATVTTLHTVTIPASTTVMIEAQVVARRTGGVSGSAEDGAGYVIRAVVKNVAGTATLIGSVSAIFAAESQAGWNATIDVTGATARVRVTGASNNNVTWHCTVRVYAVSS